MFLKCLLVASVCAMTYAAASCPNAPKHYQELGCKPVKDKDSDSCPTRYECPNFVGFDKTKCNFQGKSYAVGESIEENTHPLPTCTKKCTCKQAENVVGFECEFEECKEAAEEPKPECRNQYTLRSCCAVKSVCEEAEVKKLHTCWYEGKDYHGGNLIYPKSLPCYKCLCDEKFDNSTAIPDNTNCKPVDCGIEVHTMNNFQQGCVPVYFNDNYCCPLEFKCPQEGDSILPGRGESAAKSKPELTCKFGELTLGYKETLKLDDKCVECSCEKPPLVQCIRTITTEECH